MPTILKRRLSVFLFLCCSMLFIVMSPKTAYALSLQVPTDINATLMPDGTVINSSFSTGSNTSGDPLIISGDLSLNSGFEGMLVFKNHSNTKDIEIGVGDKIEGSVSITKVDKSLDYSNRNLIGKISWNIQPKLKTAFAVFSQDDGSLNFYKRYEVPKAGEQFEDKAVTEVYTGIETSKYLNGDMPPWRLKRSLITNSTVVDTIKPVNTGYWFYGCDQLTYLDLSNLDTSSVTSMGSMFYRCKSLVNLNLSSFDTSSVTNMGSMFEGCQSLTSLDLSSFDTSKVITMVWMFQYCSSLTSIDLSTLNTSAVRYMNSMFNGCSSLTSLDLSSFDTSSVTSMSQMFWNCKKLTSVILSSFDTPKLKSMYGMFYDCNSLVSLDLSSFNTSSVTNIDDLFGYCYNLTHLDLSSFDTSSATGTPYMFNYCYRLHQIKLGDKFAWKNSGYYLPVPSLNSIPGSDGYWYNQDTGEAYLPKEIPSNKKATYIAVNPIKAPVVTVDGSPIYGSKLAVNVTNQPSDTTETTYQWQEYNPNAAGKGWYNSTLPGSETSTLTLTTDENGISCKDKMYRCVVNTKAGLKRVPQVISDVIGPIKQNLSGAIKISTKNISGDKYQSDVLAENVQSDAVLSYEWHGKAVIGDSYGADVGLSSKHKNTITVYDDAQITISQMDNNYSRNGWDVRIKNSNNQEVYHSGIQYSGFVRTTLLPGTYTIEIINTDPVSHSFFAEYSSYKEKILPETKSSYVFSSNELKPDSIYCIVRDSSGKYIGSLDSRNS